MNNLQTIKIARKIVALDASRLRELQKKYDDEYDIFDEVIEIFEEMKELIREDESLESNRSIWEKLFRDYDPDEIQELITTHIAGGLFIKVFKMINQLLQASEKLEDLQQRVNSDLSQLTKKELLDLAKEVRKEKRFMNKANKVIPEAQRIISEMISRANNLKGNKDLKDVAKNDTVKESVADIVAALEDASDELNSHGISGNINDIIDTLKNGESKIKSQIESGNYKKEESSKPQTIQSTNIEEKLTSLDNDDEFDVKQVENILANFLTNAQVKIAADIETEINNNKDELKNKTGKGDSEIDAIIKKVLYDEGYSILKTVERQVAELANLLSNKKYSDFYEKIKEIETNPNNYFKLNAYKAMLREIGNQELKPILENAFKKYDVKQIINNIKGKFEDLAKNYTPVSLRVVRTSSVDITKIAKNITKSYF